MAILFILIFGDDEKFLVNHAFDGIPGKDALARITA